MKALQVAQTVRYTLVSLREMLVSAGPLALLAVALLVLAYGWLDPAPPKRVVLATGPAQSAYAAFGQRYARALAADGIEVVLLPSEGSQANLQLLREGRADLGFVQGGSGEAPADGTNAPLSSLGSLFVEPVWLFYREDAARRHHRTTASSTAGPPQGARAPSGPGRSVMPRNVHSEGPAWARSTVQLRAQTLREPSAAAAAASVGARLDHLTQLKGLRVNVGTPGSGVPSLMAKLLEINRIAPASLRLSQLEQTPATVAFLEGRLDALVFASAPEALMVQMLLQTPGVKLMDFAQSEAYARRLAFLSPVLLPRGVVDLAADVPPQDARLVASTTELLAHEDTHPALLQLFAQAAQSLHGGAGWFNRTREFPNLAHGEYPVAKEAERALRSGTPLLQRYLAFWLANLVERMWLALGLIIAILLPLSRIVPPLYEFRIRSRVFRWYGRLRELENRMEAGDDTPATVREALDALERQVGKIIVPLSHADELYALRNHIQLVRGKLPPG